MAKPNPQELAKQNRDSFVRSKFMEVQEILFKSGLLVGEIGQIIRGLDQSLNSMPVGEPKEEPKKDEAKKKDS